VLVGEAQSGKNWFLKRLVGEPLPEGSTSAPADSEFKIKTIIDPNHKIKLQLWWRPSALQRFDNGEQYDSWRGAHGILILVDVTNRDTFDKLEHWFREIDRFTRETIRILIVATKIDDQSKRQVWNEEILDFVGRMSQTEEHKERDIQFIETSAKNNYNIEQAIQKIVRSIITLMDPPAKRNLVNNKKEKTNCIVM
jgi:GTPase SAR1 family protein